MYKKNNLSLKTHRSSPLQNSHRSNKALHICVLGLNKLCQKVVTIGIMEHVTLPIKNWGQVIMILNTDDR